MLSWFSGIARGPAAGADTDGYRLRRWFAVFLLWVGGLALTGLAAFARYEAGALEAQGVWLMCIALFYLSICCVFFPAPTAWIVMLLAGNEVALIESVPLRVLVVACTCGFATGMANLNEYHVITFLLRYGRAARVRQTRPYQVVARWFGVAPFAVIAVVGFVPIPVDVVRWLAITYRYSRRRFFLAYFVGRTPRYALFAASAVWFNLTWWQILTVQAALVLLAGAKVVRSGLRGHPRDGSYGDAQA